MAYKDPNDPRQKAAQRKWYEQNKARVNALNTKNRTEYRKKWSEYKASLKCTNCGEDHPATFDFHHVDRINKRSVNKLVSNWQFAEALKEIEKCVVLCANCHRKLHHKEHQEKKKQSPAF
jgi:hypothetical protein